MLDSQNVWTLILAADDPGRLTQISPPSRSGGGRIPRQYLAAGPSTLLQQAVDRAHAVSEPKRVIRVVSDAHRKWWEQQLDDIDSLSVHVQQGPRGTAASVLLPLFSICARDPAAIVALMPSHHHVTDSMLLARTVREATGLVAAGAASVVTLGLEPTHAATSYEYLIPGGHDDGLTCDIARFVDRPSAAVAEQLMRYGALWSSNIVCARARALLDLFEECSPDLFHAAFRVGSRLVGDVAVYDTSAMPEVDFWREVVRCRHARFRVLRAPACGWSLEPVVELQDPVVAPVPAA